MRVGGTHGKDHGEAMVVRTSDHGLGSPTAVDVIERTTLLVVGVFRATTRPSEYD